VPSKSDEVVVHAPEEFDTGGRDTSGKLVLKPIARTDVQVLPVMVVAILCGVVSVFLVAWLLGRSFSGSPPQWLLALGACAVAPPLALGGYSFLRDRELQAYRGGSLWIRGLACAVVYALLWGIYPLVIHFFVGAGEIQLWHRFFIIPPFLLAGAATAYVCFDLDFITGLFHYGFYLGTTVLLRLTMGMPPM